MNGNLDIYSYTDFRSLLRDYYEQEKIRAPDKFSFRFFARRAGFSSPNFLKLVIAGKRNLGHESIHRFARVMGLKKRETLFFESLVLFNQTRDPEEKRRAFEMVMSFREYRSAKKLVSEQYDYFSKWYYPVIREMVNLEDFRDDPSWIAKRLQPPISRAEAEEALKRLESLQLIARDKKRRLRQTEQNLATEEEVVSVALVKFHQEMISHGLESLKQLPSEREISGLTMSLSTEQFQEVRQKIRDFHREIQQLIATDGNGKPKKVCQLNFQFFPLMQPQRSK